MKIINKYIDFKFWQVLLFGGAIIASMMIIFMIIGFILGLISDYGRLFAFSLSTFISIVYSFALIFYFPIKLLIRLKYLKEKI